MGIVNLTYRPTEKSIGGFVIDAFLSEVYQFTNEVTDVPVDTARQKILIRFWCPIIDYLNIFHHNTITLSIFLDDDNPSL
jgi:hypothetical protein